MNVKIWCKSFLSIYHMIPSLINAIDKMVFLKSVNSSNFSLSGEATANQVEAIFNLTQKKVNLINLKVLTDETLLEISKTSAKMIKLRYIDCICSAKAIEFSGLSRRTYFRTLKKALHEFESCFYLKLLKSNKIYMGLKEGGFLDEIFNKINDFNVSVDQTKDGYQADKYSKQICSFIVNKMKKVF